MLKSGREAKEAEAAIEPEPREGMKNSRSRGSEEEVLGVGSAWNSAQSRLADIPLLNSNTCLRIYF